MPTRSHGVDRRVDAMNDNTRLDKINKSENVGQQIEKSVKIPFLMLKMASITNLFTFLLKSLNFN